MPTSVLLTLAALAAQATPAAPTAVDPAAAAAVPAESDSALLARARSLAAERRYDEAVAAYDELLARRPDHVDARLARGRTQAWRRRWPEAEADLLAVTAASPGYGDAWSALGDMYLWSGRPRDAAAAYSRWQALAPSSAAPLLARSRAWRAAGEPGQASADLDAAAALGADPAAVAAGRASLAAPRISNPEATAPAGVRWTVQAEWGRTDYAGDRGTRDDAALVLRRHLPRGSIALERLQAWRSGRDDSAWALDAYVDTWAHAYANLRYQQGAGDGVLPERAWRAELFQGVGNGWELSASVDALRFPGSAADIYGVGVGRYVGDFYVRARARHASPSGGTSYSGQVRYYYAGNGDEYFEFTAGSGRSREQRLGTAVESGSDSLGVAYVRYFTPAFGMRIAAGYTDAAPDEARLGLTAYYRW